MNKVQAIMNRLIEARKAAGLTQTQAAKLLGYTAASTLSQIEGDYRKTEPNLSTFLKMCEVYQVSPVWALTGVNPDFDEDAFDEVTQFTNASIEDLHRLKESLKRMSWERDND